MELILSKRPEYDCRIDIYLSVSFCLEGMVLVQRHQVGLTFIWDVGDPFSHTVFRCMLESDCDIGESPIVTRTIGQVGGWVSGNHGSLFLIP